MKFYGRKDEIAELRDIRGKAFSDHSRFTVITGRRRIGKTSLILKALEGGNPVYLFVGRKSEAVLCREFGREIAEKLGVFVPDEIRTVGSLFRYLMEVAKDKSFDLIIDEFQELSNVNPSIYSDMQDIWDRNKEKTHINLVVSGSVYSLMHEIFQDKKEPLFGRADNILHIRPFDIATLKQIMKDHAPRYANEDLLALFAITGGVPKYVELFCDNNALTLKKMIEYAVRENSPFAEEGRNLLIEEFGKNYATYFSILGLVAEGINTQNQIQTLVGGKSVGGQLKRLIEDYDILSRMRPIFSNTGTHAVRYEIKDPFLKFWFYYFDRNRALIEIRNFGYLRKIVLENFPTYSGDILERYFRQKLAESGEYADIGSWWKPGKEQYQIDIVAIRTEKKRADVIEVKRSRRNFRRGEFEEKVEHLKQKELMGYEVVAYCLTLEDM